MTMRGLSGEQVLMRVFVGEADEHAGRPLYRALVELFRAEGLAGATVLRGVLGFGARSRLHTASLLRLSQDLPMVVEVIDTRDNIDRVVAKMDAVIGQGLVTLEPVRVIRYGSSRPS